MKERCSSDGRATAWHRGCVTAGGRGFESRHRSQNKKDMKRFPIPFENIRYDFVEGVSFNGQGERFEDITTVETRIFGLKVMEVIHATFIKEIRFFSIPIFRSRLLGWSYRLSPGKK